MRPRAGREECLAYLTRRGMGLLVESGLQAELQCNCQGKRILCALDEKFQYDGNWLNDQISYAVNIISKIIVEP